MSEDSLPYARPWQCRWHDVYAPEPVLCLRPAQYVVGIPATGLPEEDDLLIAPSQVLWSDGMAGRPLPDHCLMHAARRMARYNATWEESPT